MGVGGRGGEGKGVVSVEETDAGLEVGMLERGLRVDEGKRDNYLTGAWFG